MTVTPLYAAALKPEDPASSAPSAVDGTEEPDGPLLLVVPASLLTTTGRAASSIVVRQVEHVLGVGLAERGAAQADAEPAARGQLRLRRCWSPTGTASE